ncbi:diguanylate cyclase, partial [Methylobacterium sp.]
PDIGTVRLCSLLAASAYLGVFLALWRGRREEEYFLHWALSMAIYAAALVVFGRYADAPPVVVGGLLHAALALSNMVTLSGVRRFDGRPPFAAWMLVPIALSFLAYALPALATDAGLIAEDRQAARIGGTLALIAVVILTGCSLLRTRAGRLPAAVKGRRLVGLSMFAYVPGYLAALALPLLSGLPGAVNATALVAMLSDQILLVVLNLGLLAMPGERAQAMLREGALRDPLTGAWNRAGLEARAAGMMRPGTAVVVLDVDHFKGINDGHGHAAGDAVLAALAARATALLPRDGDVLARLGGDEFVILLGRTTREAALAVADALRHPSGPEPAAPPWTLSLGLAMVEPGETGLAGVIARADASLYRAKTLGRNRVAA